MDRMAKDVELEATKLAHSWAVRPKGQLGTMGWFPFAWTVVYVQGAKSAEEAIRRTRAAFRMQAEK